MDDILPNGLVQTLTTLSVGVILLNVFKVILQAIRSHLLLYLSQKLDIALLLGYYRHVLELPMNFFGSRRVGEIISRFNDASKVRDAISGVTLTIMIDTLMAVAGAIILYIQNAKMFGIAVIMVILYAIIVIAFHKLFDKWNRTQMEDNAQLTSYLVESLNGMQTVKAFNAERKANRETETRFVKLLKSVFQLSWISNMQGALKIFVELIGGVVILWVGGMDVINGTLTMGQLITFQSLLGYFLDPVKNLINLQPQVQTAVVAADRLGEILDLEVEKTEAELRKMHPESIAGDIEFKNVDFRYGTRQLVLQDINLKIKKGQKVAFVGATGAGKSTILNLIGRYFDIQKGEILIDGVNILDIDTDVLRGAITARRLEQEYRDLTDQIFDNPSFPYPSDIGYGTLEIYPQEALDDPQVNDIPDYALVQQDLVLDQIYDIRELGRQAGHLIVYVESDTISFELAAQIMMGICAEFDKANIPFRTMDFVLQLPLPEEGPRPDEEVRVKNFRYEDIYGEGLIDRIKAAHDALEAYYAQQDGK